ncbi:MAG: ABC transporter permease [Syntrophothermus sp.]
MRLSEHVSMAVKNLQNNKVRSALTMLGVIIGVGAVIVMVSLGEGAKRQVTNSITAMGSNLLIVTSGRGDRRGGGFGSSQPLTNDILEVIKDSSSYIQDLAPQLQGSRLVSYGDNSAQTNIIGCTVSYPEIRNYKVGQGRFFSQDEVDGKQRVAVLGSYVADELFPGENPVGQEIKVGRVRMTVVGVLAEKGQSGFGNNDDVVLVPLTTAQRKIFGRQNLSMVSIKVQDSKDMDLVYQQVYDALLAELKDENKFDIRNQAEILSMAQQSTQTFTFLLAGIAAVSLLVGGIGIMNIMLVSVTERIREIGIRKAIGAQREEILALFLNEAVILSLIGGAIGIILGSVLSNVIAKFSGWAAVVSFPSIIISFAFALATGLFFGVYPAYKAAGLNPIEALRHE